MSTLNPIEILWDNLLSRQPKRIRASFRALNPEEKRAVLLHLERMTNEPGWHSEQRASAMAALQAIRERPDG